MDPQHVIIIAEAGVNHNGNIENAFRLVDAAADAGVDYIKFQTFKADKLVSASAKKADYQIENTKNSAETQLQMLQKFELSREQHEELIAYCQEKKVQFFSTAFDLDSLEYLHKIGLQMVKIPSGEITNLPYLRKAATLFRKVILSTGMATVSEIKDASLRRNLHHKIVNAGGKLATVIAYTAHVSKYAKIGDGTVVMHQAMVNADAVIGKAA